MGEIEGNKGPNNVFDLFGESRKGKVPDKLDIVSNGTGAIVVGIFDREKSPYSGDAEYVFKKNSAIYRLNLISGKGIDSSEKKWILSFIKNLEDETFQIHLSVNGLMRMVEFGISHGYEISGLLTLCALEEIEMFKRIHEMEGFDIDMQELLIDAYGDGR